jgi:hypothetical protein
MMLALLSAVFGFLGPFVPELIRLFRERQDQAFELQRMHLSAQIAEKQHAWRMAEIEARADIEESKALHQPMPSFGVQILDKAHASGMSSWAVVPVFWLFAVADFVSTMVRPAVTYAMVGLFIAYKWGRFLLMQHVSDQSFQWYEGVVHLWDEQDWAVLLLVLGYWFGGRMVKAVFGGNAANGAAGR